MACIHFWARNTTGFPVPIPVPVPLPFDSQRNRSFLWKSFSPNVWGPGTFIFYSLYLCEYLLGTNENIYWARFWNMNVFYSAGPRSPQVTQAIRRDSRVRGRGCHSGPWMWKWKRKKGNHSGPPKRKRRALCSGEEVSRTTREGSPFSRTRCYQCNRLNKGQGLRQVAGRLRGKRPQKGLTTLCGNTTRLKGWRKLSSQAQQLAFANDYYAIWKGSSVVSLIRTRKDGILGIQRKSPSSSRHLLNTMFVLGL